MNDKADVRNTAASQLFSTKEVARFLDVNEKMVYSLVAEKGLPATKITGKWLFPRHLVEQWIENNTINCPTPPNQLPPYHGLLIIAGSNDPLLERTVTGFNTRHPDHVAVVGNLGSMGGIRALHRNLCHVATSHLMEEDGADYNFEAAGRELANAPAVVNFCMREQGIVTAPGNPKKIKGVADFGGSKLRIANRPQGTGTRLLLDRELEKEGIDAKNVKGYGAAFTRHMDVALEVLTGRADAGLAIRAVAGLLGLGFVPLRWERFDLLISKDRFFDEGVQRFLGILQEDRFRETAAGFEGYDVRLSGKMVYPGDAPPQ